MTTPTTIDTDTELSAVNSILGAIGQSPVTTLGTITEITGETIYTYTKVTATNARSGNEVTITKADHGLNTGYTIDWDFLNNGSSDGVFTITKIDKDSFKFTDLSSGALSSTVGAYTTRTYDIGLTFDEKSEIKLKIGNVIKSTGVDYTISGSFLTLTSSAAAATSINDEIKIYREKNVVNTLANPEVSFIYNILKEVNKDIQNEGWLFNMERDVKKQPDSNKHISIPANVLRYDVHDDFNNRGRNVVRRNGRLYDTYADEPKDEFDNDLYLDIVYLWPYEDLPPVFKRYITYRAPVRAATQLVANPTLVQLLQQQEVYARANCMEYECQQGDHSYLGFPPESVYRSYQPYTALRRS